MRKPLFRRTISVTAVTLATAALLLASAGSASAQVTGQNKGPASSDEQITTFKVTRQLVVEAVTVKDKAGKTVPGLTAKNFTITEDGVAQQVSFCEHQSLPQDATPLAKPTNEDVKIYYKLGRTQIAPASPGEVKYKDRRLIALYFDMSAMPPTDQLRAELAAEKFVREQMTSADLVSIWRYSSGSVDVLQDFTADRNRLLSILETLVVGEGQGQIGTSSSDDSAADTGAAFGQDDAEFNIFTTNRQLSALQTAAQALGRLNEKKQLIYFASGLNLNGLDNQAQLHATEDAAIRAGVSFWPIDARGLVAYGAMGDATQGSPGGQAMYSGRSASSFASNFQRSQDTLYALAADTGGKALLDNNDLTRGIVEAQKSVSDYYILGYYTTNTALNGKFRKIKVTVDQPTEAKLDYRVGYWAGKEWGKFNSADKDRQLEEALMQGDPWTELTVALEVNYFQLNRAEYFVPVMIKIPGSELVFAKKRGADHALIDFVGEIKDEYGGTTVTNIRDHVDAKLTDYTVAELAKSPIEYSSGYTLLPGKYSIKVLARDDQTGHIGTFQTSFVIPNLNKEVKRVPISSVVLSSERKTYQDAIYNVAKQKEQVKQAAVNPLVQGGLQIIPSVTRVFNKARTLTVFLQAYEAPLTASTSTSAAAPAANTPALTPVSTTPAAAATPATRPLIGFVSFYRDNKKVYETQPQEVSPLPNTRLQIAPLNFSIDLRPLDPGKYDCQVTVLDPNGGKGTFWQAPIMVVQ
jgi:VWFA-related protein